MSDSLADQAASWVPPWERPPEPSPEPSPEPDAEPTVLAADAELTTDVLPGFRLRLSDLFA